MPAHLDVNFTFAGVVPSTHQELPTVRKIKEEIYICASTVGSPGMRESTIYLESSSAGVFH
jgi:hypothetical protein